MIRYGARTTMLNSAGKTPADLTGNEGLRELIEVWTLCTSVRPIPASVA